MQNFVASIAGASASLIVSAPLDVIKTRIQNRNFDNPESGFRIVGSMIRNEGLTSFFKGLTPKVCLCIPGHETYYPNRNIASYDWSQACLLLLACTDFDPSFRHRFIKAKTGAVEA